MAEQFSLFKGDELKRAGISKVVENNQDYVEEARRIARQIATETGFVCSDNLQEVFPPPPWAHHNVMGAVFSGAGFIFVKYIRSYRPSAHGRMIRLYRVED